MQREFYSKFFFGEVLSQHSSLMSGESTPSYLLHYDIVIPRLKAVAPDAKVLSLYTYCEQVHAVLCAVYAV
jgi:hypothetical protein